VTEGLEIVPVSHVDEVLARALTEPLVPIEWSEADDLASQPASGGQAASGSLTTAH
jgi:ATP-dependent Lon protease